MIHLPHQQDNWDHNRARLRAYADNTADEKVCSLLDDDIFSFICGEALNIESLFVNHCLNYLYKNTTGNVVLSQRQILCLLCLAVMDMLPACPDDFDGQPLTLKHFFTGDCEIEKIKCLSAYFTECKSRISLQHDWQGSFISITRDHLNPAHTLEMWCSNTSILCSFEVFTEGAIESTRNTLQADFANKYIGGGVLHHGCLQEEIRFVIAPECLVSLLFCEVMDATEAILIRGTEIFSSYRGYAQDFSFNSSFVDEAPCDAEGYRQSLIVAYDAECYPYSNVKLQYTDKYLLRDLNKCLAATKVWESEVLLASKVDASIPQFATGNWGCGAFQGDPQLKSMQQWVTCSLAGRDVQYFVYGDRRVSHLAEIVELIQRSDVLVGQLCTWMQEYREIYETKSFFDFLKDIIRKRKRDV